MAGRTLKSYSSIDQANLSLTCFPCQKLKFVVSPISLLNKLNDSSSNPPTMIADFIVIPFLSLIAICVWNVFGHNMVRSILFSFTNEVPRRVEGGLSEFVFLSRENLLTLLWALTPLFLLYLLAHRPSLLFQFFYDAFVCGLLQDSLLV